MRVTRQLLLNPQNKELVEEFFNTTSLSDMSNVKPLFEKQVDRNNANILKTFGFYLFGSTCVGPVMFDTFVLLKPAFAIPMGLSLGLIISPFIYKRHFHRKIVDQIEVEEAISQKKN